MATHELNIEHIIKKGCARQEQTETFRFWVGFYVIQLVEIKKSLFFHFVWTNNLAWMAL